MITVVGESSKRETIFVSAASDTFEFTWNISKRGRKDENILKRGRRFEIRSNNYIAYGPFAHERTIQFNSDVATSRRTHKHGNIVLLFARANEGDGWKPTSDHLPCYYVFTHKDQIRNRIIVGRIISARHSENTFRNVVNLRFWCPTSIFSYQSFANQLFTSGVQSFKTMDTMSLGSIYYYWRGSKEVYILQSTYVPDWLIVDSFPSIRRIGSITIGT